MVSESWNQRKQQKKITYFQINSRATVVRALNIETCVLHNKMYTFKIYLSAIHWHKSYYSLIFLLFYSSLLYRASERTRSVNFRILDNFQHATTNILPQHLFYLSFFNTLQFTNTHVLYNCFRTICRRSGNVLTPQHHNKMLRILIYSCHLQLNYWVNLSAANEHLARKHTPRSSCQ